MKTIKQLKVKTPSSNYSIYFGNDFINSFPLKKISNSKEIFFIFDSKLPDLSIRKVKSFIRKSKPSKFESFRFIANEKNKSFGGRARQLKKQGFTFDMGPSWYWMPDVFEKYFKDFDKDINQYLNLKRLDPSYRVFFDDEVIDIPANYESLKELLESMEEGSGDKLDKFLKQAEKKYKIGIENLVYKPGLSISEFINKETLSGVLQLDVFQKMHKHIRKYFKDEKIIKLIDGYFVIIFL